jgi:hypothetical protein
MERCPLCYASTEGNGRLALKANQKPRGDKGNLQYRLLMFIIAVGTKVMHRGIKRDVLLAQTMDDVTISKLVKSVACALRFPVRQSTKLVYEILLQAGSVLTFLLVRKCGPGRNII